VIEANSSRPPRLLHGIRPGHQVGERLRAPSSRLKAPKAPASKANPVPRRHRVLDDVSDPPGRWSLLPVGELAGHILALRQFTVTDGPSLVKSTTAPPPEAGHILELPTRRRVSVTVYGPAARPRTLQPAIIQAESTQRPIKRRTGTPPE